MPNRVIREAILTSARIDTLSSDAEVFYRRLLSKIDDHGLYDARPAILRASLYPLRIDKVKDADCASWLAECHAAKLLSVYEVDGKQYLQVADTKWQIRSEPRFPPPSAGSCVQPQAPERKAKPQRARGGPPVGSGFEEFWNAYPRKVAKADAQRAFAKLNLENGALERVLAAVKTAAASSDWTREGGRFIPHASTWLNGRRWEDEQTVVLGGSTIANPFTAGPGKAVM